jgi:hypothetical protein
MRHYVVEKWIDAGGEEVCDARDVSQHNVNPHEEVVAAERLAHYLSVDGHNALSMEWCPAEEKTNDNGDWNGMKNDC